MKREDILDWAKSELFDFLRDVRNAQKRLPLRLQLNHNGSEMYVRGYMTSSGSYIFCLARVAIAEEFRGQRIFTELLPWLEKKCSDEGVITIVVESVGNDRLRRFLRKHGYKENLGNYLKSLKTEG